MCPLPIVPQEILQHYTFDGRIQLKPVYSYFENGEAIKFKNDKLQIVHEKKKAQIWSRQNIEATQELYRKDIMAGDYGIEVVRNMTRLIKEYMIEQVPIYLCDKNYYRYFFKLGIYYNLLILRFRAGIYLS